MLRGKCYYTILDFFKFNAKESDFINKYNENKLHIMLATTLQYPVLLLVLNIFKTLLPNNKGKYFIVIKDKQSKLTKNFCAKIIYMFLQIIQLIM